MDAYNDLQARRLKESEAEHRIATELDIPVGKPAVKVTGVVHTDGMLGRGPGYFFHHTPSHLPLVAVGTC